MKFLKLLATLLLFSWDDIGVLEATKLKNFYPFGESEGDKVVTRNDDGSSGEVPISFPFPFFGQDHNSLFVSIDLFPDSLIRSHWLIIMGKVYNICLTLSILKTFKLYEKRARTSQLVLVI